MILPRRNRQFKPVWTRYGAAIGCVLVGWLAREALSPAVGPTALPFIFFFPAIAMAAWYARLGPGVAATLLSAAAAAWFFIEPVHRWNVGSIGDAIALPAFVLSGLIIVCAIEAMHRARASEASQRILAALTVASIGDAVIATDEKAKVTFLNREAERLTGWSKSEALGQPLTTVFNIINERTRQPADNPVEKVLRTGKVEGLANHTVLVSRDGKETPIDDSAAPIRDGDEPVAGVVLVFRDVTEQRRAREASARLAAIVEHSGDVMLTKNLDGIIQTWNASAEKLFGYRAEEIIGKHVTTLFPPDRLSEEDHILGNLRQGKAVERLETVRVAKDGRRIPVALSVSPLRNAEGELTGASKVIHDITELVSAREALLREKELLATTLASIGDAVIVTDVEGRVTFLNEEAERLTKWKSAEAAGHPLPEVFRIENEHTRQPVENPVEKVLRLGGVVGLANHTILIAKDGTETPIDDSAAPIRNQAGGMFGVVLVFRDFTERKRAEKTLRDSQQRLERVLETGAVGVLFFDYGGTLIWANSEFLRITGYPREKIDARELNWRTMTPPEWVEASEAQMKQFEASGRIGPYEKEYFCADGTRRWLLFAGRDLADGTIAEFCVDITERKHIEEALRRSEAEARAASRAKDDFLAALSHELRTPLTPVLMSAAALASDPGLPVETREQLAMMRRNIELEARLIDDLLDITRISHGKLALSTGTVDLHQLLDHTAEIVRSEEFGSHITISFAMDAVRHHGTGDAARLQQVFWNLIKNALKFTPGGGSVSITTLNDGDARFVLCVEDTGIGIAPADLERIFNAFEQGETTRQRRAQGLGLGLAISKKIVELHGGAIRAESAGPGRGSKFTVTLATVDAPTPARHGQEPRPRPGRSLRLLVVDDHEPTLNVLTRLLSSDGHHVVGASTMRGGLDAVAAETFDVVVSDLGLPDGSGLDLMREIRLKVPIAGIALSGYGMEEDITEAKKAGFYAHLVKPVDLDRLRQLLTLAPERIPER